MVHTFTCIIQLQWTSYINKESALYDFVIVSFNTLFYLINMWIEFKWVSRNTHQSPPSSPSWWCWMFSKLIYYALDFVKPICYMLNVFKRKCKLIKWVFFEFEKGTKIKHWLLLQYRISTWLVSIIVMNLVGKKILRIQW